MSSPRLIVVTGGPCSGKTTLIEALERAGHHTVREAAIDVIGRLNERKGVEGQVQWRRDHPLEFQRMVFELQVKREDSLHPELGVVFLDRGIADGIAYCRNFGIEPPGEFVDRARRSGYAGVFLLETLESFDDRPGTGRMSSREDSLRIGRLIEEAYQDLGVSVTRLGLASNHERVERVLDAVFRTSR